MSDSGISGGVRMPTKMVGLGMPAPGFTLESSEGGLVSLSDHRGRPVVLYLIREFT